MIESWVMGRLERPVAITSTSVKSLETSCDSKALSPK
jgi:hypothetical protein